MEYNKNILNRSDEFWEPQGSLRNLRLSSHLFRALRIYQFWSSFWEQTLKGKKKQLVLIVHRIYKDNPEYFNLLKVF